MIEWIKKLIWRRRLESGYIVSIERRTNSHGYSLSEHNLQEMRSILSAGDLEKIRAMLSRKLKIAGLKDADVHEIMQSLNEEKVKVVVQNIGLLSELERREQERNYSASSSPISS